MKKLLSVLLAFLLLATIIPLGAFSVSAATSGTTGNCTWVLNGTALTISGNGAMEDYAYECGPWGSDITSLTIKSGVTYIGSFAFIGCRYLSSVSIPSSVTDISAFAFEGCPLTSLTISEGVKYILEAAFSSCNLTSLTIPNSVIEIGDAAFGTVGALSIGSGLSYVKWRSAFSNVSSVNISSENKSFVSSNGVVFDKNKTTLIYCLRKKAGAYTIPNGVIAIEDFAFNGCSSLTSITISSSVTSIGNYAFNLCSSLTAINVNTQNSAYSSADGVLFNKNKTTLIHCPAKKAGAYTIPDTVTSIKTESFYGCSALTSITIPCSVTSIGSWAFYNCKSLSDVYYSGTEADRETIAINSGNDYLLNATWHYAPPKSLLYEIVNGEVTITGYTDELPADLIIPDTVEGYPVTAIGDFAFFECPLNSVIIPNSVTTIGSCAFSYSGLYEIFIPAGVTDIDPEAFHACAISFTVDENNRYYSAMDGILFNKDQTTIVACGMLWSYEYTVPDTVTTIGQFAFFGAYIESLIIPVSVVSIEDYAFATARITDVYYGGTVTDCANIAVGSFNNDRLINATWHYHYGQSHTYDHDCDATCNACGNVRDVDHDYHGVVTAPDCANGGYTTYTCSVCGDNYVTDHTEATGHNYVGEQTKAPTCAAVGVMTYTCSACGDSYTEEIAVTNEHTYDHAFDASCNVCGAVREVDCSIAYLGASVSENVRGLAMLFQADVEGIGVKSGTILEADFTNATYNGYKLLGLGAFVTNGIETITIKGNFVYDMADNYTRFAFRLVNIPADKLDVAITMTPYYAIEIDGVETMIYCEPQTKTYNEANR